MHRRVNCYGQGRIGKFVVVGASITPIQDQKSVANSDFEHFESLSARGTFTKNLPKVLIYIAVPDLSFADVGQQLHTQLINGRRELWRRVERCHNAVVQAFEVRVGGGVSPSWI